jgi:hypothetical protein
MTEEYQESKKEMIESLANLLGNTFFQRRDIFGSQLDDGRYLAIKEPLTTKHLVLHIKGEITLGTYILATDSTTNLMAFDTDANDGLEKFKRVSAELREDGIPSYLETSRRGGHLWFFFDRKYQGERVRMFGKAIIGLHNLDPIELFPKQSRLGLGPGSLLRLPFGKHRITNTRYPFILPDGNLLARTVTEQIHILSAHQTVPEGIFELFAAKEEQKDKPIVPRAIGEVYASSKVEKIKKAVDAVDFIGSYIDLRPVASGAVGKCPFHDDNHPSLGVNKKGNYWHCFAGCGSGSIINFWMKWRGINFSQAVEELGHLLDVK